MQEIHDSRGLGVTRVYDGDDTFDIVPKLKAFACKLGVPQCTGDDDREELLPFNTDPI